MLKRLVINERVYTKSSDDSELELLLLQHLGLDRVNDIKVELAENELLTLKSWLIKRTERDISPGSFASVGHGIPGLNGGPIEVVFARGKTLDGEIILWHEPFPWPEDWPMEKSVVRAPSTLELIKIDGQLALRYDDIIGILIASEAFKFIEVLKSTEETDFDEPHMVQFSNGSLAIRIYEAHINFEFEIRQPRFSNLSTSIDRGPIQANLEEFERVVRSFFS